jgi:hypothetical protein
MCGGGIVMPTTAPNPVGASLAQAGRCLDELDRALQAALRPDATGSAEGLDVRRVRTDLVHLRESLALLSAATTATAARTQPMVEVPDTPYDPAMWRGVDDEGVGCRHC